MFASRKTALFAAAGLATLLISTPLHAYSAPGPLLTGMVSAACLQPADEAQPARRPAEVRREYDLNPKKAQAFFELLAPSDVKVMVGQREGGVFIKGTPREARVFDAFVEILTRHAHRNVTDPDAFIEELRATWDSEKNYKLPPPKADALYRLLAFNDVPVLVSRAPDGISIQASTADQKIIADIVRVLKGQRLTEKPKAQAERPKPDRPRRAQRPAKPAPPQADDQGKLEEMVNRLDARRKELEKSVEELTERAKQIAQAVDQLGAQIEQEAHRFAEQLQQRVAPPPQPSAPDSPKRGGETIVREYRLPGVHAQNLFNLLAPSDIRDVIVSRRDDVVEIRADAFDQETIARLVDILTRDSDGSAAR